MGFILGSHPDGFYAGEAAKTRFLQDDTKRLTKRVCKLCGENCPVWGNFYIDETVDLYEQISAKVHKPLIIDSAKNVDWIQQQLNELQFTTTQPFLVFLQRDGRAVINSRIRKYPNKNVKDLILDWINQIRSTSFLFENFSYPKIKIRYEELATDPATIMKKICTFLDIDFYPEMLNYDQHEHHVLGGNSGTQFLVAKSQSSNLTSPFVSLSDRNKYYYEKRDAAIALDLRWKKELDPAVETLFNELAGIENQELRWNV